MNLTQILGVVLALSIAGNAWLFHSRDLALERAATQEQAQKNAVAAASACSASVNALGARTDALGGRIDARLAAQSGQISLLQHQATQALQARPDDPADLCGSLLRYWRGEIGKEGKP